MTVCCVIKIEIYLKKKKKKVTHCITNAFGGEIFSKAPCYLKVLLWNYCLQNFKSLKLLLA